MLVPPQRAGTSRDGRGKKIAESWFLRKVAAVGWLLIASSRLDALGRKMRKKKHEIAPTGRASAAAKVQDFEGGAAGGEGGEAEIGNAVAPAQVDGLQVPAVPSHRLLRRKESVLDQDYETVLSVGIKGTLARDFTSSTGAEFKRLPTVGNLGRGESFERAPRIYSPNLQEENWAAKTVTWN